MEIPHFDLLSETQEAEEEGQKECKNQRKGWNVV